MASSQRAKTRPVNEQENLMSKHSSHNIQYVYAMLAIALLFAGVILLVFEGNNVAAQAGGILNVIFTMFICVIL